MQNVAMKRMERDIFSNEVTPPLPVLKKGQFQGT